jgi:uncharacterized membrane protein YgcG
VKRPFNQIGFRRKGCSEGSKKMKTQRRNVWCLIGVLILVLVFASGILAQVKVDGKQAEAKQTEGKPAEEKQFKQEELDQMLAAIALYPDALLVQILMASTYPLEVVQADRWAKQNKDLKGDALTAALEKQGWDPSVKSLVNFPQTLSMMSEKIEWMQSLGDAFLEQEKDVMNTVQNLRKRAHEAGNLKTTKEQVVIVEKETQTIIIEPADPKVIYVPAYNPTVVYGVWVYPAYPPYPVYVYPPAYTATAFAVGVAWGYAWGHSDWHGGDVNINNSQNININNNIDRGKYAKQQPAGDRGKWQHDPSHRKGVSYRDQATQQKYNRGGSSQSAQSRDAFRGRTEQGRQDLSRGSGASVSDRASPDRGGRDSAVGSMDRGSNTKMQSDRGSASRQSMSSRAGSSGSGSFGGASRSSGGASRGGGGRR